MGRTKGLCKRESDIVCPVYDLAHLGARWAWVKSQPHCRFGFRKTNKVTESVWGSRVWDSEVQPGCTSESPGILSGVLFPDASPCPGTTLS